MKNVLTWFRNWLRGSDSCDSGGGFDFSAFLNGESLKEPDWSDEKGRLRFEINRGTEVAALLNNEIVRKTVNGILHGIQNEWLREVNPQQRELMWQQAQGVQKFVASLGSIIDTGKMATYQLKAIENEQANNNQ